MDQIPRISFRQQCLCFFSSKQGVTFLSCWVANLGLKYALIAFMKSQTWCESVTESQRVLMGDSPLLIFFKKKLDLSSQQSGYCFGPGKTCCKGLNLLELEPTSGVEPLTCSLRVSYSTN